MGICQYEEYDSDLFREQSQQPIMVAGLLKTRESERSPSCVKSLHCYSVVGRRWKDG